MRREGNCYNKSESGINHRPARGFLQFSFWLMEEEKEYITQEELEKELAGGSAALPQRHKGLALLLGAVLLVAAGAMTGYYWYLFQKQQGGSNEVMRRAWEEAVLVTNQLTNRFNRVEKYQDFLALKTDLTAYQRQMREARYSLPKEVNLSVPLAQTRLEAFLDDYADLLVALDQLIAEGEAIVSKDKLNPVKDSFGAVAESYDELLLAGRGFVKSNLPRAFFNFPTKLDELLTQFLEEQDKTKADETRAEEQVKGLMEAFIAKDEETIKSYLTENAKKSFNPGILEDTREFSEFSVIRRERKEENYILRGQIKAQSPDGQTMTENWEFIVKEENGEWLVDQWGKAR